MSVCSLPWCRPSLLQYGGQAGAPCRVYHSPAAQQQPEVVKTKNHCYNFRDLKIYSLYPSKNPATVPRQLTNL